MFYGRNSTINYLEFTNCKCSKYGFSHARTALKYGLISIGAKSGDHLLIPDFICDVVLQPLNDLGIRYSFFQIGPHVVPNLVHAKSLINDSTIGIIMVNYFGFPVAIDQYIDFCKINNLLLIEDNAHGFGGIYRGKKLGTIGDIAINSVRKVMPIPNGALLYIRGVLSGADLPIEPIKNKLMFFREVVRNLLKNNAFLRKMFFTCPPYHRIDAFRDDYISDWSLSESVYNAINNYDINKMQENRMDLFKVWHNFSVKNGFDCLFGQTFQTFNSCVPLLYPALCENQAVRDCWLKKMFRAGFDAHTWPSLPIDVINQGGFSIDLWQRLICFPINNGMNALVLNKKLASYFST